MTQFTTEVVVALVKKHGITNVFLFTSRNVSFVVF